jgi:hypothetical protein
LGLSNGLLPSGSPHTRCIHLFLPPLKPHATPILLLIFRMTYGDGTGRDRTSPIPVTAQSKAWICGHFFVRIEVLYPASSTVFFPAESVVCCQEVNVSAKNWCLVQRSVA